MILSNSNEPFKTLPAAKSYITRNKLSTVNYRVEQCEGGFAVIEKIKPVAESVENNQTSNAGAGLTKMDNTNKDVPQKATKPWSANENRWKPDIFKTSKKHEGFALHFSDEENVQQRIDEGYQLAKAIDYGASVGNSSTDGVLRRSGMVGMEISIEDDNDRKKYLHELVKSRTQINAAKIKADAKQISKEAGEEDLVSFSPTHNV